MQAGGRRRFLNTQDFLNRDSVKSCTVKLSGRCKGAGWASRLMPHFESASAHRCGPPCYDRKQETGPTKGGTAERPPENRGAGQTLRPSTSDKFLESGRSCSGHG